LVENENVHNISGFFILFTIILSIATGQRLARKTL